MKNIEDFNLKLMNQAELVTTQGGQCDCSPQGASHARAVKGFFSTVWEAVKKVPPTSPYYVGKVGMYK